MHMAAAVAAAWVAWAVWTCNTGHHRNCRKRADFGPLFFLAGINDRTGGEPKGRSPMKASHLGFALTLSLWTSGAAFANDAPPTDESIRQMFTLTRAEETMNGMKPQLDAMITASMKEVSHGKEITPERQAILDRMRDKIVAAYNETFGFESMQLILIRVYQATYTQDEVDGLIAFYKTPAGQALINKSPLLMQNLMGEMQSAMRPVIQRIGQIKNQADQELKGLSERK